jgi:hypothetical protein
LKNSKNISFLTFIVLLHFLFSGRVMADQSATFSYASADWADVTISGAVLTTMPTGGPPAYLQTPATFTEASVLAYGYSAINGNTNPGWVSQASASTGAFGPVDSAVPVANAQLTAAATASTFGYSVGAIARRTGYLLTTSGTVTVTIPYSIIIAIGSTVATVNAGFGFGLWYYPPLQPTAGYTNGTFQGYYLTTHTYYSYTGMDTHHIYESAARNDFQLRPTGEQLNTRALNPPPCFFLALVCLGWQDIGGRSSLRSESNSGLDSIIGQHN